MVIRRRWWREERREHRVPKQFSPPSGGCEPNYTTNLMNEWASKYSGSYKPWAYINHGQCRVAAFVVRSKRASLALALCGINSRWLPPARERTRMHDPQVPHGLMITTFLAECSTPENIESISICRIPIFRNCAQVWMVYVETRADTAKLTFNSFQFDKDER